MLKMLMKHVHAMLAFNSDAGYPDVILIDCMKNAK